MNVNDLMVSDQHDEGLWMTLRGPDGKEVKGAQIHIVGPYSEKYQKRQAEYYRKNIGKAASVLAASEGDQKAAKEVESEDTMLLQCLWAIDDWKGLSDGKKAFACTEENKRQLLTKAPYIKADVYNKFRRVENFTGS